MIIHSPIVSGSLTFANGATITLPQGSVYSGSFSGSYQGASFTGGTFSGNGSGLTFGGTGIISGSSQLTTDFDARYLNTGGDGIDFKNTNSNNSGNQIVNVTIEDYGMNTPAVNQQAAIDCRGAVNIDNVTIKAGNSTMPDIGGIRIRETGATTGAGGHNSNISNIKIELNSGVSSIGLALNGNNCNVSNFHIDNCLLGIQVRDSYNRVSNGNISGCTTSIKTAPLATDGIDDIFDLAVTDVVMDNSINRAVDIATRTLKSIFKGCTFRNVGTGEAVRITGTTSHHVIDGCNFLDAKYVTNSGTGKVTTKNNIGYATEANVLSGTIAIDSTGTKLFVVPHGLNITPLSENVSFTLVRETLVNDVAIGYIRLETIDATNITGRLYVTTASATAGATVKVAIKIQQPN